jgi:hypothetical protein
MRNAIAIVGLVFVVASCRSSVRAPARQAPAVHGPPAFEASVSNLDAVMRDRIHRSWHQGCPVDLDELRVLRVDRWTFDGTVAKGTIIVHRDVAESVRSVFEKLFSAHYPIFRMEPIDAYEGDDDQSIQANNSSAFNCREVTGVPGKWSQHAYGKAIDLNPIQNPYVRNGIASPPQASRFVDRSIEEPGVIHEGDAVVRAFQEIGWGWGGQWKSLKDYQHFSQNGR